MPIQLNEGLYSARITGAWLKEDGTAVGFNVVADQAFYADGSSEGIQPVTGTAYLNFYKKDGTPRKYDIAEALKIFVGLDANTWNNFEQVAASLVTNNARVYLERVGDFTNIRTQKTGGGKEPGDTTAAKRNLAMLTRGMQSAQAATPAAPVQSPARTKLVSILKDMAAKKQDWKAYTGGKQPKEMSDAEIDAALAKISEGPDLTPPPDDIPF